MLYEVITPRGGIVGEIYVKYSPLANNHLEEFLISEGCEPVVPGLLDFVLYCAINTVNDGKLYDFRNLSTIANKIGYVITSYSIHYTKLYDY